MNHLKFEKSPYLLEHANNPVGWYPWGDDAFTKARLENKLIFLSIGYATCHWCHVMASESFENRQIAELLNASFVPIKVDREERPDIDAVYMSAVTALTGQGGWPLSVFLTPEKIPFNGGTYFPPYARWGAPGFFDLLKTFEQHWQNNPDQIYLSSRQLTAHIQGQMKSSLGSNLSADILSRSFQLFQQQYDSAFGGIGNAPKFPMAHNLSFLLRYFRRSADIAALEMVETTLTQMFKGGIYDHLGGGFHRYSVDRQWRVPHFEKMLYDQAMALRVYLEAYEVTQNPIYAEIAKEIVVYVDREMRDPRGGFYSAQDADSFIFDEDGIQGADKKEGAFYLWSIREVKAVVGPEDYPVVAYIFGLEPTGNTLTDPHHQFDQKNVIFQKHTFQEVADQFHRTEVEVVNLVKRVKGLLREARDQRPKPNLDDKILTDWNALMIGSLAMAGAVLEKDEITAMAETAMGFILERMFVDGQLWHRYRDGEAGIPGMLDDYAFLASALLDLYEVTGKVDYLQTAKQLLQILNDRFWDTNTGGYFFTAHDAEVLISRMKPGYDGAVPSGNSLAALALVRMYHLTQDPAFYEQAEQLFHFFAVEIERYPLAYSQMLAAFDFALGPVSLITFVPGKLESETAPFAQVLWQVFLPNKIVRHRPVDLEQCEQLLKMLPSLKDQLSVDGRMTAYVCQDQSCQLPVFTAEELKSLLKRKVS